MASSAPAVDRSSSGASPRWRVRPAWLGRGHRHRRWRGRGHAGTRVDVEALVGTADGALAAAAGHLRRARHHRRPPPPGHGRRWPRRVSGWVDCPIASAVWAAIADAHAARITAGDTDGWLLGDGWSLDQLGGWPTAAELERLAPARPVALWSHDHHARWASRVRAALGGHRPRHRVGPGRWRPGPPGCVGRPDRACCTRPPRRSLDRVIPALTAATRTAAIERLRHGAPGASASPASTTRATSRCHRRWTARASYRSLAAAGGCPSRVAASVREIQLDAAIAAGMRTGRGDRPLSGRLAEAVRGRVAGLPQRRTAGALRAGRPGRPAGRWPGRHGHPRPGARCSRSRRVPPAHGIAVQIHGIGDAAVRAALDVLEPIPRRARA